MRWSAVVVACLVVGSIAPAAATPLGPTAGPVPAQSSGSEPAGIGSGEGGRSDGEVLVANFNGIDSIQRYALDGTVTASFDESDGLVGAARAVEVGPDGLVYVAGADTGRVIRYDPADGSLVDVVVDTVAGLVNPRALAFDADGNLLVASSGTDEVVAFDPESGERLGVVAAEGLDNPGDMIVDDDGRLWVTSQNTDSIIGYSADGEIETEIDTGPGSGPVDLTVGPGGVFHVAMADGGRVDLVTLPVERVGLPDSDAVIEPFISDGLVTPTGVSIGPDGVLWVADHWRGTIRRFDAITGTELVFASRSADDTADPVDDTDRSVDASFGPTDLAFLSPIEKPTDRNARDTGASGESRLFVAAGPADRAFNVSGALYDAVVRSTGATVSSTRAEIGFEVVGAAPNTRGRVIAASRRGDPAAPGVDDVWFDQVLPGVDLVWTADGEELEYSFVLEPGIDPGGVRVNFLVDNGVWVDVDGNAVLGDSGLVSTSPVAYQDTPDGRIEIASRYLLHPDGTVGFFVDGHDPTLPLVIDPTFRAAGSANSGGGSSITVPKPTGTTAGDVLLASIAQPTSSAVTPPAGWTAIRSDGSGSVQQDLFYRVAGASEPASYVFTTGASEESAGAVVAYSDVDTTQPINAHSGQVNGTSTSYVAPSLTTTVDGATLVGFFAHTSGGGINPPAGMTERVDQGSGDGATEIADELLGAAGSTGTRTATGPSSVNVGQLVALRPPNSYAVSGTVFEDTAGDVLNDGTIGDIRNPGAPNVDVLLYSDVDGDGIAEATDTYLATVQTDVNGDYTFTGLGNGKYFVVVDSLTVQPSAGIDTGNGWVSTDVWAEQTYGPAISKCADGVGGTANHPTPGPCFGGRRAGVSDDLTTWHSGAEHIASVGVASASVVDVDFGFSFDVVTTTAGGDNQDDATGNRTMQGTLRQFLWNANATLGTATMRFVPAGPADVSAAGDDWWRLSVSNALPPLTDGGTTVDGRAYDLVDGASVRDTNTGKLGTNAGGGLTVGVDDIALPQIDAPELELVSSGVTAAGIEVRADSTAIRRLAIHGFGDPGENLTDGDIEVPAGQSIGGLVVESNVIGTAANSFTDPGAGNRSAGSGVALRDVTGAQSTIRNNLFGFVDELAVSMLGSDTVRVTNNEILDVGQGGNIYIDALSAEEASSNVEFTNNLVDGAPGNAISFWRTGGSHLVRNNTIRNVGTGGAQTAGVFVAGSNSTIERNIITNGAGPAVTVAGENPAGGSYDWPVATGNRISRNTFGSNDGLAIDLTESSGNEPDHEQGDGVTLTAGLSATTGNNGLDAPTITSATTTDVDGTACANCDVEVYRAVAGTGDNSGGTDYGEGVEYLGTATADGGGSWSLTGITALSGGDAVSAIAIDASDDTSEFAANATVSGAAVPVVLDHVETGTATLSGGLSSVSATIAAVDPSRSFLTFSLRGNDANPNNLAVTGELTNATTVTFERPGTTGTVTIEWSVVEFSSGVSVQRGTTNITATTTNVAISSVDLSRSFAILSDRAPGTDFGDNDFMRAELTSPTNLRLSMTNTNTNVAKWQVVTYNGASVQSGTASFGTGDVLRTATITAVDPAKTWLMYSISTANGTGSNIGQKLIRGRVTDGTTLTFDRSNTGQSMDVSWFAVEFTDGTEVQHASAAFAAPDTTNDVVITAVDPSRSIAVGGYKQYGGRSSYSAEDNPGVGWFTTQLTSATNLRIQRDAALASSDLGWFVVHWPCTDADSDGLCDDDEDANTDADNDPATNPGPDTDGDTTPNYLDSDDDGDGTPTASENADPNGDGDSRDALDSDRDGQPDFLDAPTGPATGLIAAEQKISETEGGLTATLTTNDRFGRAVASIGDVDGDGVVDIAVGAPFDDDGSSDRGAVYILFLNGDGTVKAEQKISDTAGGLTAVLDNSDEFGMGVAGLGDLDGDGIPDVAVGAHQDDDGGGNLGAVHVLFLNTDGTVKAEQKISHTQGGLATALDTNDRFGSSVATIGDLDGDGLTDIVVGAKDDDDTNFDSGAVYVLFLNADGTVKGEQKISNLAGGLSATLSTSNGFGIGVAGPGDVDGDGIEDVAVGAWYDDDGGTNRGAAYVLFLNTDGTVKGEQKISDTVGGFSAVLDNNDVFGTSVGAVGDLDDDGVADLIVGAPADGDGASLSGAAYVLFLNTDGTVKGEQKISNLEGNLTTTLDGSDQFGYAVAGTGDLDEDGTIGVMVGVYGDDDGGPADRGAVYVLDLAAEAAVAPVVLDNIQKGTATIGNGSSSSAATITAVDPSKAFLVFSVRGDDTSPENISISGRLTNATTVDFNRLGTSGTVTVEWSVVEFASGVTVQRGTVTPGGSTTNVALTSVDLTRSFPLVTMRADGVIYEGEDWLRARFTSDTNLELATNGVFGNVIEWQVVEYNDAAVQSGSVSFAAGDSSRTATVTAVDPAKSWLIYNFRSVDGTTTNIGQKLVRGRVTDSTTLTFDRSSTGQTIDLEYFLVEFTDNTAVQHASQNYATSTTTHDVTISAVDTGRSIAVGGYAQTGGRSAYTANDNPGTGWFTTRLTSATNLRAERGTAPASADLAWTVVEWPPCPDSDSDGLCDHQEDANTDADDDPSTNPGPDTDGDSTSNYLDADDDGDGTATASENADPNGDGDPRDALDADWDGQPDYLDAPTGPTTGTVADEQKISDLVGGLAEPLVDLDDFGFAVEAIGDLDGDGTVDLAVGAWKADDGGSSRGEVNILFLNPTGTVKAEQKISSTSGGLAPLSNGDRFGAGVAAMGDLDGDGIVDLAVGADLDDDGGSGRGAVHILFLNADGTVKGQQKISDLNGGLAAALDDTDQFGRGVAGLGDLDGDGINDLAVGAGNDDDGGADRGAVHVLFLNGDGTVKAEQKISDTTGGLTTALSDGDAFGRAVAGLGDLDGDGIGDLLVGANLDDDGGTDRGAVYVLFLNADGTVKAEQKISDTAGGLATTLIDGDTFGYSAAAAGDLDGDGIVDAFVGARGADRGGTNRGAVYTLLLNTDGTVKAEFEISSTSGALTGPLDDNDRFGNAVAGLGDLDGDGTIGLAVGAQSDDDGGTDRGAVYVLDLSPVTAVTVNSTGDTGDATPGDTLCDTGGTNSEGDPECTLRAAIEEANAYGAANVDFAIPTSDPGYSASPLSYTFAPASPYPLITSPIVLDATTQAGYSGDPIVELDGTGAVGASGGLILRTDDSTIRGFAVHSFVDEGLEIDGSTGFGDNNTLQNNWVGLDAAGTVLGNGDVGILVTVDALDNLIGGAGATDGNVVAGSTSIGVLIRTNSTGNAVLGNSVYANTGLGLDLDEDGVTPNDAGDGDAGSNDLLNFPVISSATESGGTVTVTFDLDVPANPEGYRVEFFANPGGSDPSGHGEGEQFVSAATVSPGTGLTHNFAGSTGDVITATATVIDSGAATGYGPTSEYSEAATVGVVAGVPPTTVTFREGNNGYAGTVDTWISSNVANQDNSADPLLQIDNSPVQHGLIRFDDIIGPGANQIPVGATIVSADLTFEAADPSAADASLSLYRVLRSWVETDTWNSLTSGISTDDVEANSTPDAVHTGGLELTGTPITIGGLEAAVQAWVDGNANQGWLLTLDRTNGWDAQSSENADTAGRPALSVTYVVGPVTHTVNSTGDGADANLGDAVCDTGGTNSTGDPECTLRAAIEEANAFSTVDIIEFAMPATEAGHSAGVWTITPGSALPNLSDEVTIDGSTQTGWSTTPVVELDGTSAGGSTDGFRITADNVTIRSLAINRFGADGIELVSGAANALVAGNHIGLDASGAIDRGNGARGIDLGSGSGPTTVGGTGAADRNVISGNSSDGIIIWASDDNVIIGNYIGTDVTGNASGPGIGNGADGIAMGSTSAGNTVGQPGAGNVLSGNANDGFENDATGPNNIVQANMIGLGADGATPVGNGRHGVVLYNGANNTTIGGGGAGEGNVISGNGQSGAIIDGAGNPTTTGNVVAGNLIGTDATGLADRGNGTYGIHFFNGATGNTIGGPTAADGNVISGNGGGSHAGIFITGSTASANVIQHNDVGVNGSGTAAIANNLHGIWIDDAPNTQILDNLVSGNNVHGVYVFDANATGTQILRNSIGVNATQTATIPNGFDGIRLEGTSSGTTVGTPGNGNVIGGNADHGVNINSSNGNTIQGNHIGTDSGVSVDLGNTDAGIYSDAFNSSNNLIGGVGAGDPNVVAFNGVGIQLDSGDDNSILGNSVYSNTGVGIDLGGDGVTSNDGGDGDGGSNDLLNFPVLLPPLAGMSQVDVDVDLPAGDHRIEVFSNPTDGADASGHGEGETILGATTVTHTGSGVERFTVPLGSALAVNDVLAATTTEDLGGGSFGSSSEFSAVVTVGPAALTVNSTGDGADSNPGDGYCDTGALNSAGDPECTLRAAVAEVNALGVSNVDTDFAIPASDAGYNATPRPHWTISPASPLPAVTAYHDIDATSQTGWAALAPVVYVDGASSGATDLFHYDTGSSYSLLDGLGIVNAPTTAVRADVDYIYLNNLVVGVEVDGTTGAGSGGDAVVVNGQHGDVRDSVISASGGTAVRVTTAGSDLSITESYIGTGTDGTGDFGNTGGGIIVDGGDNHVIGLSVRDANVIAHNSVDVQVNGAAGNIAIENNLIGVDLAGAGSAGSVPLEINTSGPVQVGGVLSTESNTIRYGTAAGVTVAGTATASIIGNAIWTNGGLGIDLEADGVTANDPGDGDAGPNGLLNFPVLSVPDEGDSLLTAALDVPAGDYRIEVFTNPTDGADPSGHGEGETLLATKAVTHTGSGSEDFMIVVPAVSLGQVFTATATVDLGGGSFGATSEFSAAVAVAPSKPVVLDSSVRRSDLTADGGLDPVAAETVGVTGRALPFDGFGDRLVGPALNISDSALTMTARVRPDTLSGTSTLVSKRNTGGSPIYELTVNGAGQASATLDIGGAVTVSGGSVTTGTWHDIVATWDGVDVVLHVDGVEVDRTAAAGSLSADIDASVAIGNRSDGSAGFDGLIDHVDITHDPITATEAALRHANTVAGTLTVTVGQQQTGPPGPWTVTTSQSRSGTYALAAPVTTGSGSAAWAVATGIDEPGVVFESWWWINSTTGVDLSSGTRAGASATDQFDGAFIAGSDWALRRRFGATTDTDGTGTLAPATGTWVKVEQWTDQNGNSRLLVDGTEVITWTGQTSPPAGGSVGFRVGQLPGGQFWFIDDPRARKLISPEPVATLGPLDRD